MIRPFRGSPRWFRARGSRVSSPDSALVLGDVTIGDDASVWFNCASPGRRELDPHQGPHQRPGCLLPPRHQREVALLVEEEVSIAHNVMLHGCTIRKGALIGMSTTIMDGAEIGEGCLVAAGSLVREASRPPPPAWWRAGRLS